MKHLGIIVAGGFMARNVLRSGVLDELLVHDVRITLFVPEQTVETMQSEFVHERVSFVAYRPLIRRGYRFRKAIKNALLHPMVWTVSSRRLFRYGPDYDRERAPWWFPALDRIAPWLTTQAWLKRAVVKFENTLFPEKNYDALLARNKPDLLFSTSITTGVDVAFIKSAKRLGIPTVGMTKGWDIFLYALARVKTDTLLTQNRYVRENAIKYQMYQPEEVEAVGFPQFDMYLTDAWKLPKKEVLRRMGLSPDRKTIFFGSCGRWSPHDDTLVDLLIEMNQNGALGEPVQIIVRPHFTDVHKNRYDRFRRLPNVHVDDGYNFGSFGDNFDVSVADAYWLANIMYHADAICIYASTLALDATMLGKPFIFLFLKGRINQNGEDISHRIYLQEHFQKVLAYNIAPTVNTKEELIQEIKTLFRNPNHNENLRNEFRAAFLTRSDGTAVKRIARHLWQRLSHNT